MNPEEYNESPFWQKPVRIIPHCLFCGSKQSQLSSHLLDEKEESRLIYISCLKCHSSYLASLAPGTMGMTSLYMVTDCNLEDVMKFKEMTAISADEVLSFYDTLQTGEDVINW